MYRPDLSGRSGPRYRAIAEAIADDIAKGRLNPGFRLPTHRALAERLGVTVGTITRAYAALADQGCVSGEVGRGTYVTAPPVPAGLAALVPPADDGHIDMSRNEPAYGPLHTEALADTLRRFLAGPGVGQFLGYASDPDFPGTSRLPEPGAHYNRRPLREAGARWMAEFGVEVPAERVLLTVGAQQALAAAVSALAGPGDPVLLEWLTYGVLAEAVRQQRRRAVAVRLGAEGIDPAALDRAAQESGARVVFCVPTLQNPTSRIMSEGWRRAIVEVARRRDLVIVEDDVYGFLRPEAGPHFVTLAPERTVYIVNASKFAAPGLRVGWMAAPAHLMPRLLAATRIMTVMPPALTFAVVADWVASGVGRRLADWQRGEIAARQKLARGLLDGLEIETDPASLHLLLHLPRPWSADGFQAAARERGVGVLPASAFLADAGPAPEAVRVAVGQPATRERLTRALATLRDLAHDLPRQSAAVI